MAFQMRGYELVHHGEGRWNGVAIAVAAGSTATSSRTSARAGAQPGPGARAADEEDFNPFDEARMCRRRAAASAFGRALYAPERPRRRLAVLRGKLGWYERLRALARRARRSGRAAGGRRRHEHRARPTPTSGTPRRATAARTSRRRSAPRSASCSSWGLVDGYREQRPEPGRYTWWDYRAGNFHKNFGHAHRPPAASRAGRARVVVGRDRSRGAQGQADPVGPRAAGHRPRRAGRAFDAGWAGALERIAARTRR